MEPLHINNCIPGVEAYAIPAGLGTTYLAKFNEQTEPKLHYMKSKDSIGYESNTIPLVKSKETGQFAITLHYPINIKVRKIMTDVVTLGGRFADFSISDPDDTKGGLNPAMYSVTIYLNSSFNKYEF